MILKQEVPALSALNMRLRDDYVVDATAGVTRWNRVLQQAGLDFRITLPNVAFNRRIGEFSAIHTDTSGAILTADAWRAAQAATLPSVEDNQFIASLMQPAREPGQFASWIAPPRHGIDNMPGDFEYVQIAR
jgi:benzoyl-CoA 2,3-dioxygenase component B